MNENDRLIELRRLAWPLGLTRFGMFAEQAVRAFWPLWTVILTVWAVIAFDLHSNWPIEWLWLGTLAGIVGAIGSLGYAWRNFRWQTHDGAVDRLDRSMPGRPLTATFDHQAIGQGDEASQLVWDAHIIRTKQRLAEAKPVEPDLKIAQRDPYALRYAALLFFGLAVLFGSVFRVSAPDGIIPGTPGEATIAGPSWEAWIEPPVYTGKPTLYLNEIATGAFSVPVGSQITFRLYGEIGSIAVDETVSGETLERADKSAFTIPINRDGTLRVEEFEWQIAAAADAPPKVWFEGLIERSVNGEMRMPFSAWDDYAVERGTTTITLDLAEVDRRYGLAVEPEPRESLIMDLPMPLSGARDSFSEKLIEDLSEHPWAGLNVNFSLGVTDVAGQDSEPEIVPTTLPGRRFFQPIAKAVVEQRRDLLWSRENANRVGQILRTITYKPEGFFPNEQAFLTIRRAMTILDLSRDYGLSTEKRDEIADLLWRAAVLLEEGRLSDALDKLRRAQDRLSEAMKDGATDEEIAELMNELSEAMREYMEQLAQNPQEGGDQQAQNQNSQEITQDQLQEMLDRIQELMEEGRMDEAQELLSELMEMMQNMQVAEGQQGQGQQSPGEQAMEGLQDTLREQQGLSDEAFRDLQEQFNPGAQAGESQGNKGRSGGQGEGQSHEGGGGQGQAESGESGGDQQNGQEGQGGNSLADRQQALRDELSRQKSGPLPGAGTEAGEAARDALDRAEGAMDRAEEALRDGQTADALGAQSDAMEALREGMRALGEAMAENQQNGQQGQNANQFGDSGRDPLGREAGTNGQIGSENSDMLGAEDARRRSRELLDEIRRRSGEQDRPEVERDYLNRLLDQF